MGKMAVRSNHQVNPASSVEKSVVIDLANNKQE